MDMLTRRCRFSGNFGKRKLHENDPAGRVMKRLVVLGVIVLFGVVYSVLFAAASNIGQGTTNGSSLTPLLINHFHLNDIGNNSSIIEPQTSNIKRSP